MKQTSLQSKVKKWDNMVTTTAVKILGLGVFN